MRKRTFFYLLVAVQISVLLVIAGSHFATLQYGKRVLLKTEPIDPRDIFYGDYVILNYDISTLSTTLWQGEGTIQSRDKVYVLLEPGARYYEAIGIFPNKPDISGDKVVLKGIVQYVTPDKTVNLNYGIERNYVEEGTGKSIEQQTDETDVAVRVAPWGQIAIEELVMGDR